VRAETDPATLRMFYQALFSALLEVCAPLSAILIVHLICRLFIIPEKTDSEALPEFRHGLIPAFELRLAQGEHDFSRLTEFLWKISAKSAYLAWQW